METYILNCFPWAYKDATTTSHVLVLAQPGPEPEAVVILTYFDKCIALGLVVQQVGEGHYECLLGEALVSASQHCTGQDGPAQGLSL
jgi:hypothetical protein